ncbi:dihydroorotase [Halobacillus andaensis]|uniref:Dihydroorotase n=1 Tax=Halobacillus andaensis TaxID=1176239 RepID=A0A917ETW9_HALAA|nr:dihydroorotase [Halobacillus andaensis]MBP2003559.1 dihydroorotase [Halobacillus andaensis]GGF11559.1 dihydroorotase [Halobacillus andaensis]
MSLIIKNAKRVENGEFVNCEVLIKKGTIEKVAETVNETADQTIDAEGQLLAPGLVDVHIHLREPGGEAKETIATGTRAAAKGGFTTVCAMPNTRPVPDHEDSLKTLNKKIEEDAVVRVLPYASITTRQLGKEMVDFESLKEAGAFAFTDDGVGVQEAGMMYEAMLEASRLNKTVVAHCEDNSLVNNGVVHEGDVSRRLNVPGIPNIAESVHIARDVLLAEAANCHYHVCHVSTKESVRVIRDAKKAGIHVTAEVTPHHLLLNEEDVKEDDAFFKMNPPLRSKEDQQALIDGLLDGTLDCIATDHAPHTEEEKQSGLIHSPFGITGLETAFPLLYTHFVEGKGWSLEGLVDWLTVKPSRVFDLPYGTLNEGAPADLTVINLTEERTINRFEFVSKGKNTPFHEQKAKGWPVLTIVNGEIVWEENINEAART